MNILIVLDLCDHFYQNIIQWSTRIMEFKKSMIIIMLAVFLISIASVSASDVNDTAIASDQTTVEISKNEEIILNQDIEQTNNERDANRYN